MEKRVILITGTPCVGKTTTAKQLTTRLNARYINLTEFAETHNLTMEKDAERNTIIINEQKMLKEMRQTIDAEEKPAIIVDGHFAAAVVPKDYVTRIFVLRRNPIELRGFMEKCGFQGNKLWENLASEILDVCLIEALQEHGKEKVCELDITGKTVDVVVDEIIAVLNENKKCGVGCVDWLGMLEREGLTEEYLRA
ncbi:AAA family ATPase [Candidatus Bathyarchaeota archaeon A05DMB-2]|jgi:adenylate kinase|nr:AAA family ATPase [Candidatus Bathyarchaeota archaeon A05DMB-2]